VLDRYIIHTKIVEVGLMVSFSPVKALNTRQEAQTAAPEARPPCRKLVTMISPP
jgi:hypothetical protein